MYNAERQRTGLGLPEAPVYFALAPLFHITGMVCELVACLTSGGTLVLAYRFDPGVVLDAFAEHRPSTPSARRPPSWHWPPTRP